MSARVYFMKRVKDCKNVSIMSPQEDGQVYIVRLCTAIFLFYLIQPYMLSKHKQTNCMHILNQNII